MSTQSTSSCLMVKPTHFQGSFPPERPGECNVSTVGLDNGNIIKIHLNDIEQAELLGHLICAAPDLLEACKQAERHYLPLPILIQLRNAIAKAGGAS